MVLYKNLNHSFLFEFIIGLISLLVTFIAGVKGIAVLALLALRPFIFERSQNVPEQNYWELIYNIFRVSVILTTVSIILTFLIFKFYSFNAKDESIILLTVIPWFVLTHGLIGVVFAGSQKEII